MAMPIANPMMPDSARGVSKHRSSPKSRVRPSVTRKTPPRVPDVLTEDDNVVVRSQRVA